MLGKKRTEENRNIIAVKNYSETVRKLKEEAISFSFGREVYVKLLESQSSKLDNLGELKKFIKANKKDRKEVGHYWESLIMDGYTLINVEYPEKRPSIEQLCNNEIVKFVCKL